MMTLDQLNAAPAPEALQLLDGLYEHSPWIAEQALTQRPFQSLAQLKHAMARIVAQAGLAPHDIGCIEAHGTGTAVGRHLRGCTSTRTAIRQRRSAPHRPKAGIPRGA